MKGRECGSWTCRRAMTALPRPSAYELKSLPIGWATSTAHHSRLSHNSLCIIIPAERDTSAGQLRPRTHDETRRAFQYHFKAASATMPILLNIIVICLILYGFTRYMQARQRTQRQREEAFRRLFYNRTGILIPHRDLITPRLRRALDREEAALDENDARIRAGLRSLDALKAFVEEERRNGR